LARTLAALGNLPLLLFLSAIGMLAHRLLLDLELAEQIVRGALFDLTLLIQVVVLIVVVVELANSPIGSTAIVTFLLRRFTELRVEVPIAANIWMLLTTRCFLRLS